VGESSWGMKLTIHFNLAGKVQMSSNVPPIPHMPSWCAQG